MIVGITDCCLGCSVYLMSQQVADYSNADIWSFTIFLKAAKRLT